MQYINLSEGDEYAFVLIHFWVYNLTPLKKAHLNCNSVFFVYHHFQRELIGFLPLYCPGYSQGLTVLILKPGMAFFHQKHLQHLILLNSLVFSCVVLLQSPLSCRESKKWYMCNLLLVILWLLVGAGINISCCNMSPSKHLQHSILHWIN